MVTQTDTGPNKHKHGLTATDKQIAGLVTPAMLAAEVKSRSDADTALDGRITKLEGGTPPPKPPDPPGPLPTGTTPTKAMRDAAAAGSDATSLLVPWLHGPDKLLDLDGLTFVVSQIASTTLRDKEIYNGAIAQTAVLQQNGPGKDSALWWLQNGTGGLYLHDLANHGKYAGRPAGSDGQTLPAEVNHGIHIQGGRGIVMVRVGVDHFGGDGVYVGGWEPNDGSPQSADITLQDSTILDVGRMGIALASGAQHVMVIHNTFDRNGWNVGLCIEPNGDLVGGAPEKYSDIQYLANRIGRGNSAKYTLTVTNASNKGGNPVTLAGIVAKDNVTLYADTPWHPYIYDSWKSAVTDGGGNK